MRIFRHTANVQQPLFEGADTGSGGGGGFGGGAPAGGGSTGSQAASGFQSSGHGQGAAPSPVSLSDDTPISHDGKTMTWKEYRAANYVPKSDYDNVRTLTRREIENNLRKLAQTINTPRQQPQQQGQPVDPFAKVRGLPIVDGDTVAALAENGFGQIGQTLQQQQNVIQQMAKQLQKLQGGVGTLAKERSGQERTSRISQALSSLGEGYDAKDPFLNEIAQDVLDAWEFEKPEEFPQMVQQRIQAAEKFFRARDKARLEAAKNRKFVRPGGGASPSGQTRFDPRNAARQAADMLFGNPAAQNT
jgi:hypothetical protein